MTDSWFPISSLTLVAIEAVPAFPGEQNSFPIVGLDTKPAHNACSLPPEPMTRTLVAIFEFRKFNSINMFVDFL